MLPEAVRSELEALTIPANDRELDNLINGGTIEKQIHEDISYDDIHESEDNLWNFLFFTGYMKKVSERRDGNDIYLTMTIPNAEIASIYENHISNWFKAQVKSMDSAIFCKAVMEGDTDGIADYVSDLLAKSISTFDSREGFRNNLVHHYHISYM